MDREEIKEKIFTEIEEIVWDDVERNENLEFRKDIGFDSLDCVELLIKVERIFGISIADEEVEPVKTVEEAINLVASKVPWK